MHDSFTRHNCILGDPFEKGGYQVMSLTKVVQEWSKVVILVVQKWSFWWSRSGGSGKSDDSCKSDDSGKSDDSCKGDEKTVP